MAEKIVFFHLKNDYSGSPKILRDVIRTCLDEGKECEVWTSRDAGFLSGLHVKYQVVDYSWSPNKWVTLVRFMSVQLWVLIKAMRQYRKADVKFYINTLLPFGAALAGWLTGKKVVYHLHESFVNPRILNWFLKAIARNSGSEFVFVSHFLKDHLAGFSSGVVVHNSLDGEFLRSVEQKPLSQQKNILLIASLRWYKGIHEFVKLASNTPQYSFSMVCSASQKEIDAEFEGQKLPDNLTIYPVTSNVQVHYKKADVIVNLSVPEGWIESFGMTVLEGMAFGCPAIVPPHGGVKELVDDGVSGFYVDPRDTQTLSARLVHLLSDEAVYKRFSEAAKAKSQQFSPVNFSEKVLQAVA